MEHTLNSILTFGDEYNLKVIGIMNDLMRAEILKDELVREVVKDD